MGQLETQLGTDEDIGKFPRNRSLATPEQVRAALNISERTLFRLTAHRGRRKPKLDFVKLGKAKRFEVAAVLAFIKERTVRAA